MIGNVGVKFPNSIKLSSNHLAHMNEVIIFDGSNSRRRKIVECLEHVAAKNTLKYSLWSKDIYFKYIWQSSSMEDYRHAIQYLFRSIGTKNEKILNYMSEKKRLALN